MFIGRFGIQLGTKGKVELMNKHKMMWLEECLYKLYLENQFVIPMLPVNLLVPNCTPSLRLHLIVLHCTSPPSLFIPLYPTFTFVSQCIFLSALHPMVNRIPIQNHSYRINKCNLFFYSSVPNKRPPSFINFWKKFPSPDLIHFLLGPPHLSIFTNIDLINCNISRHKLSIKSILPHFSVSELRSRRKWMN